MARKIKCLIVGILLGILGISFYELFGKPVLPTCPDVKKHDVTFSFDYERLDKAILNTPLPSINKIQNDGSTNNQQLVGIITEMICPICKSGNVEFKEAEWSFSDEYNRFVYNCIDCGHCWYKSVTHESIFGC